MASPIEKFLSKLPDYHQTANGWTACCPAHDDHRASLSIGEGDGGCVLVNCFAGCSTEEICRALGLNMPELFDSNTTMTDSSLYAVAKASGKSQRKSVEETFSSADEAVASWQAKLGNASSIWDYHDASGDVVGRILRWDKDGTKEFRPVSLYESVWKKRAMPAPRPLYRLAELANATRVYVCEGEKAADAAQSIGLVATTSPGGAKAADNCDWSSLAGKDVVILPDNDEAGRKYADSVHRLLSRLIPRPTIRVVELPNIPPKGDIADWINGHGDSAEPEGMVEELERIVSATEPAIPISDGQRIERFQPFPVHVLPEPIRSFVATAAASIGCDTTYVALPMLAVLAAAIGNSRVLQLKQGWKAPAILWTAIVGESGTAKTPAFSVVLESIRRRERIAYSRYEVQMRQFKAEEWQWKKSLALWKRNSKKTDEKNECAPVRPIEPQCERYVVNDTTVEALAALLKENSRGLLLACDELSAWLGSFDKYSSGKGSSDAGHWLSMFNGQSLTVDRKTGTTRTIFVQNASISICGGIQPGILHRILGIEHRESGLLARFLLASPPRKSKQWTETEVDVKLHTKVHGVVDHLYDLRASCGIDGANSPVVVRMHPIAKKAWMDYYDSHALEQSELTGDLSSAWSKLEEYAARLALVIHLTRWAARDQRVDELHLDAESMVAGITLAEWFKRETRRVYSILSEGTKDSESRMLIEWIDRKGGTVTAREVQQGCRAYRTSGVKAEQALQQIVNDGYGEWVNSTPGNPGQPTRRLRLFDRPCDNSNPRNPGNKIINVDVDRCNPHQSTVRVEKADERGIPDNK